MAAINAIGTGNQSGNSNAVTPVAPATVPGAPTIGTATAGNAQATVTWTAPASNGGSAITGYVVTPYIGAAPQTSTTVGNVLTTPITGLTNGTAYTFRVAAINAIGTGNQSGNSNAVTPVAPATVPGAPTIGTATAGNAQATVTWSAPASNGGSAITGYVVTPYIGAAPQTSTTVGNVLTTPITGLTNGTSYTFRVAAINAIGTGNQSADSNAVTPVAPATVPGAPTIGTATAGNAQATVTWSAPASNGGSAITGYVVTPYIGAAPQTSTTVGNVLTTPITGLTNGTSYTFRVAAINAIGTGNQSADSNAVTPVAPATVPGAPTIGTATAGNAQATVTWTAPASNGGSAITGYVVTPYIGAAPQTSTTVGNVLTTPITGLTNGTSYTFRVAAINAIGTGNQSGNSNAVTPTKIAFRSSSTAQTKGNKGASTLALNRPVGAVPGDVLIASIDLRGMATVTPPSDWALIGARQVAGSGSTALQKSTYWHTVGPGEPVAAVYSWTFSTASTAAGAVLAYGGVDTSSFDSASQANPAGTVVAAPTVTAAASESRLVGFFATATTATFTPPGGMAERCEVNASAGSLKLASEAADSTLGGIGPTGPRTATASKSAVSIGQLIVLSPLP